MRNLLLAVLVVAGALFLCACGKEKKGEEKTTVTPTEAAPAQTATPTPTEEVTRTPEVPEGGLLVLNRESEIIGTIPEGMEFVATDSGILYIKRTELATSIEEEDPANDVLCGVPLEMVQSTTEYHIFRPGKDEDRLIGSIEGLNAETVYARTSLGGKIYTLFMRGDLMADGNPLMLLEIDPKGGLKEFTVSETGYPYAQMTAFDGKIYITCREPGDPTVDYVYEFAPASGKIREVLRGGIGEDDTGESFRQITTDGEKLYLLVLRFTGKDVRMIVRTLDAEFRTEKEQDITGLFRESARIADPDGDEDSIDNQIIQPISSFRITKEGCLFYQNFSIVTMVLNLNTEEILLAGSDLFSVSLGGGEPIVFTAVRLDDSGENYENRVFVSEGTELVQQIVQTVDSRYRLDSMSVSGNGTQILILAAENDDRSETLIPLLYYWKD